MMKHSIRTKLFWGISLLTIFFVVLSWVLNFKFLDKFYVAQKGAALNKTFSYINKVYGEHGFEGSRTELEELVRSTGISFIILNKDFEVRYFLSPRSLGASPPTVPTIRRVPSFIKTTNWSKPTVHINASKGPTEFMNFTATLRNGDYIWLGTPLAEMKYSVAISNQFFLLTGILTIIIGIMISILYSKKFTGPILELNALAQNMAKLDFTKTYPVKTSDEIGELGGSINSLSEQLGKSISELQQANQLLEQDNERQKRIDENRREFISNVSHELKTPIALIQGYAEGLKLNVVEDEVDKNFYCKVIMDETAKMDKLVRDLLDLAEIDAGYLRLDKQNFDLAQLTLETVEKYKLVLKEKSIDLSLQLQSNALVEADIVRIEQVLVNYLNNAINHIDHQRVLKVLVQTEDAMVRLAVFNSGPPIPDEIAAKIWFSFYKADKARTRSNGGTGLGLSIVKAIVDQHHGSFGVNNLEGGVEFWFELPAVKSEKP